MKDFSTENLSTFHKHCGKIKDNILFLFRQEKNEKKPTKGWLFTKPPPFRIPLLKRKKCRFSNMTRKCPDFRSTALSNHRYLSEKRRGIPKGAHLLVAPLRLISLVTFLFSDKKVTYTIFINRSCGMLKDFLWRNLSHSAPPHPLWKSLKFSTPACGQIFIVPLSKIPLIHISFPYYC